MAVQAVHLCWDYDYSPHLKYNKTLAKALRASFEQKIVVVFPAYQKLSETLNVSDSASQVHSPSRYLAFKLLSRQFVRKALTLARFFTLYFSRVLFFRQFRYFRVSASRDRLRSAWSRVNKCTFDELLAFSYKEIAISDHLSVDLSLNTKTLLTEMNELSDQLTYFKQLIVNAILLIDSLEKDLFPSFTSETVFFSTSVYSFDWIANKVAERHGYKHFTAEFNPYVSSCSFKLYSSQPFDYYSRRLVQESAKVSTASLGIAAEYALQYLKLRLSPYSSHTYSPLSTDEQTLSRVLSPHVLYKEIKNIWVYYTNSPDELVSITHAFNASSASNYISWSDSPFLLNEYESISLLASLAKEQNALLIVRLHPRLASENRSRFVSSEYFRLKSLLEKLKENFSKNFQYIDAAEHINSYELGFLCDKVISFRGTMPLEMALLGIKPIVLAKNRGIMNYWIKSMSDAAPSSYEELESLLTTSSTYTNEEFARFIVQFYIQMRSSMIDSTLSNKRVFEAINNAIFRGSSVDTAYPLFSETDIMSESRCSLDDVLNVYIDNVKAVVSNSFC